uniref:Superkiller complex protein 8 n=1 Tax=Nothobranchius kadleci TaxID=1051664 RepID=A0A1A8C984_NOTKA
MSTQYSILFKQEHAHDDAIWTAAWGKSEADGSETIITGSLDDMVKVWKWSDEKLELQWTLEGHQLGVVSVDISQNGAIAASSSLDAHIRLWDLESGKQVKSMDAGPVDAWTVAFSPDSKHIATGSHHGKVNIFGSVKVWDASTRTCINTFFDHQDQVWSVKYNSNGSKVVSAGDDRAIHIYDCPL